MRAALVERRADEGCSCDDATRIPYRTLIVIQGEFNPTFAFQLKFLNCQRSTHRPHTRLPTAYLILITYQFPFPFPRLGVGIHLGLGTVRCLGLAARSRPNPHSKSRCPEASLEVVWKKYSSLRHAIPQFPVAQRRIIELSPSHNTISWSLRGPGNIPLQP